MAGQSADQDDDRVSFMALECELVHKTVIKWQHEFDVYWLRSECNPAIYNAIANR
jgi:hypothetical protein